MASDSVEVLLVDRTFGTEELSAYSRPVRQTTGRPCLTMSIETGKRIGLQNKDRVVLSFDGGPLEVEVALKDHMAEGLMTLPRQESLAWQKIGALPASLSLGRIKKADQPEVT